MVGNTRPTNKRRKSKISMAVYKIFGPKSYLEQVNSKNDVNCETHSDMAQEEMDIRLKPAIKKKKKTATKKGGQEATEKGTITMEELEKHDKPTDCWIALFGKVYDITKYVAKHPGGRIILHHAGTDATRAFEDQHPSVKYEYFLQNWYLGELKK
jgi:cytochrome b involved in lipid metabolism